MACDVGGVHPSTFLRVPVASSTLLELSNSLIIKYNMVKKDSRVWQCVFWMGVIGIGGYQWAAGDTEGSSQRS